MSYEENKYVIFAPAGKQSYPTSGHWCVTLLPKIDDK